PRKHHVFALLSDVANDPAQTNRLVPFTQFATDLANGTLPTFSNIVPNLCNDAHDCGLDVADSWLQTNIAPLIASPVFQQDGLLIIVFDEAGGDNTNGGGRIVWVAVSPKAKRAYQSTTLYQNQAEDFLAVGFTATGDSADIAVSWSATGGTIDSSSAGKRHYGHYTSATCGTFTVTATSHPGNVSTAVSVSVTGCPLPVASVSVTPGTATIGVGQTAQYAAITRDAFGNPLGGRTVT